MNMLYALAAKVRTLYSPRRIVSSSSDVRRLGLKSALAHFMGFGTVIFDKLGMTMNHLSDY